MNVHKDREGDTLKRALDTKATTNIKHAGKPFWLRRDIPEKDGSRGCTLFILDTAKG